ncbi:MAG TPA: PQQ-binding-like beta-propeller repeat protein [Candidatus Hydrogenedentes bacterium]|nr:PQQ-binding-like beta-propeller repeat protein [Candidatus Hydrogenedentota bacterium]
MHDFARTHAWSLSSTPSAPWRPFRVGWIACVVALWASSVTAADWPTYRHDIARSARTDEALELPLARAWTFTPPHPPAPAWPDPVKEKARDRFDEAYHVAVAGDALYFATSSDCKVYCLDANTGDVRWSFLAGGPMRVAPMVSDGRIYVGSDDGCAYALRAEDGALVWRVRAAHRDERVLGNGKMISLWPVRTGVIVDDGTAYFGAGVFSHEGLFLCAARAEDGALLWRNDTCGNVDFRVDFGGMTLQGPLLASATQVFTPAGRAMPAVFRRDDGAFHSWLSPGGKFGGTWALLADDKLVAGIDGKKTYSPEADNRVQDAPYAWFPGQDLVVDADTAYLLAVSQLVALDRPAFAEATRQRGVLMKQIDELTKKRDNLNQLQRLSGRDAPESVKQELAALNDQLAALYEQERAVVSSVCHWRNPCSYTESIILAGDTLYLGGQDAVAAIDAFTGEEVWRANVPGRALGLAAANGRLYVSTQTGEIHCFAPGIGNDAVSSTPGERDRVRADTSASASASTTRAETIIQTSSVTRGYTLVLGSRTGALAAALARRTDLHVVAVDTDADNVARVREASDAEGLYGVRVQVDAEDAKRLPYADYFANLIVCEGDALPDTSEPAREELARLLKPCGGVLCIPAHPDNDAAAAWIGAQEGFSARRVDRDGVAWHVITRGPLPGAGQWTHQYAEPGNSACSDDLRVRGALGVLWFGLPGPGEMVERHARAAAPLAKDGRMFVQGENVVMAYDSYNGLELWRREIPGAVRVRVDSDMSNFVLGEDSVFVAAEDQCYRLDAATGETVRAYPLPDHNETAARWGYLACTGSVLLGSIAPPLTTRYSALWDLMVGEDGRWRDVDAVATEQGWSASERDEMRRFLQEFREPDRRAYERAQQAGLLWRAMSPWPAWGSVESPVGAVTERIMASKTLFALDVKTGALLWRYDGEAIAHPAIAIAEDPAGGTVFLADCNVSDADRDAAMKERAALIAQGVWEEDPVAYEPRHADVRRVIATDARTGDTRWERVMDLTGCGGDRLGLAYADGVLCFFGCFSNHDRQLFRDGRFRWRRVTAVAAEDCSDMWSRPLNYLRRPVIVGDQILIEPRACDLRTGAIIPRPHPLTGAESEWEFVRPGHCCSVTSACPNMFFLRGYFLWYYDLEQDLGMLPFAGIRPGCWINTIPANGVVLFPEASAGCTCSYPVRSTVVLVPKTREHAWALFVQHGAMTPVRHMAVNFGAPGDRRDADGTLWFAYPHPASTQWYEYGTDFRLNEKFGDRDGSFFTRAPEALAFENTDKPWLFASGCRGMYRCTLPLLDEGQGPARYTVRLYFAEPDDAPAGARVFDVALQGETVLAGFDIRRETDGANAAVVKEFRGVTVKDSLVIELTADGAPETPERMPVLNAVEAIREDAPAASTAA